MTTQQSDKDFFLHDKTLQAILEEGHLEARLEMEDRYREIMEKPLLDGNDLINLPFETNDYLIENLLWKNDTVFILAQEKAGKSIFSFQMALSLTCGEPFLEMFDVARPMKVLYVQAEGSLSETQDRIRRSIKKLNWNPDLWRHYYPPALSLDTDEGYNDFVDVIRAGEFQPDIIFLDPLYMAMEGDLSDNKAARKFCRNIRRLKETFDCAVLVNHHEHRPKLNQMGNRIEEGDGSIMGSFVWKAFASHVLRMKIVKEKGVDIEKSKVRKVTCGTQRSGNVTDDIEIRIVDANNDLFFELNDGKATKTTDDSVYAFIKHNGTGCVNDIVKVTGINKGTAQNSITRLRREKKIVVHCKEGNRIIYKLNKS